MAQRRESKMAPKARRGTQAVDGIARWFGVAGDRDELLYRQQQYKMTRGQTMKRRNNQMTNNQNATLDFALEEDESESGSDNEYDADKQEHVTTRDPADGLAHYQWLHEQELQKIVKPGWFGGEINKRRASVIESGLKKDMTRHRRQSKYKRDTLVQAQLQALPEYRPIFIEALTLIQVIIMIFVIAHSYTEDALADFGFADERIPCTNASSPGCVSFNGTLDLSRQRVRSRNPGFGPTSSYLISLGGKFSPCMREDENILKAARRQRFLECGPDRDNPCESTANGEGYGCCTLSNLNSGMMLEADCTQYDPNAEWVPTLCDSSDIIALRPCCGLDLIGSCEITTEDICAFSGGVWQQNALLCSEVMCLGETCQLLSEETPSLSGKPDAPNEPDRPSQFFRFIVPLFFHASIAHAVLVLTAQVYYGRKMERHVGVLRSVLIYFISGVGGNAIAAIFSPNIVTVGANPAVYGILGVHLVDLFQSWQIVPNAWRSLGKLGAVILVLLIIGTTQYVDNWSHIGGFAFGMVAGIVFIPYITFGKWDLARKRLLLLVCMPLLLLMFIAAFVTFYQIQNTNFCTWCDYLNCIPYSPDMTCESG
eukprot:TRINITY_DN11470_c1_g4_i1.p1 TRINITY_DN11470_c1_g4~~TRINITY_DN11470_c1_g4_i1.p1  ORF type:complete len:597 (+),score=131.65 TRINITY_DN11470_c1_g4_i1:75-1865(+)